jgi:sugar phosphate isomerase/epimerase
LIRLSCSSLSCDGFGDNKFVQSLIVMPKIGYKYIELNCWQPSDLTPNTVKNLKRRCKEVGLIPSAVYGSSFGGIKNSISKDVCHKLRMIDAAVELDCHRIVATGAKRGEEGGLDSIIAVLKEIVPYAEEKGVLICLENHANNNLETIEDYEAIFAEIDSPNVGVCIDTGHFDAAGVSLDEVVDRLHHKVNHIHVKEAIQVGVEKFVRFGTGVTDNLRLIEQMLQHNYSGFISVEMALEDKSDIINDLKKPYTLFNQYQTN